MLNGRMHILLVSPDIKWRSELGKHLAQNGFELVGKVADAASAVTLLRHTKADLVILEARLPDVDGLILCQLIQVLHPKVSVVLTAKDHASLQLAALQANASGCINRDLPLAEWVNLLAYINKGGLVFSQAVVEETLAGASLAKTGVAPVIIGPLVIDVAGRLVKLSGQRLNLTPREFSVLACLARNVGRVVTFDQLLDEAWGYDEEMGTEVQVRVYIGRLRRKLVGNHQPSDFIVSERGVGYRLLNQRQWHQNVAHNLTNMSDPPRLSDASPGLILPFQDSQLEVARNKKGVGSTIHDFLESLQETGESIWHHAQASLVDELWPAFLRGLHQLENEVMAYGYELLLAMYELPIAIS